MPAVKELHKWCHDTELGRIVEWWVGTDQVEEALSTCLSEHLASQQWGKQEGRRHWFKGIQPFCEVIVVEFLAE